MFEGEAYIEANVFTLPLKLKQLSPLEVWEEHSAPPHPDDGADLIFGDSTGSSGLGHACYEEKPSEMEGSIV